MTHYKAIIIGGGASGMMAAGTIAKTNPKATVLVIERNKTLGAKLSITGGGRCNITNATFDTREMLKNYGDAEKFLHSAFDQFNVQSTFDFFQSCGLEITVQERNRAFPKSEKATDVTAVMKRYCSQPNVKIMTSTSVQKISGVEGRIEFIETERGERYTADSYIIATGGLSHPETGSTGDGFNWLADLGHTVKQPTPTLVPWKVSDSWIHAHAGTALDDVKITINVDGKKYFSCTGRILCTHEGLSGPTILNNSSRLQDALLSGAISSHIDLYPNKNHKEVDQFILDTFERNKNKKLKNVLSEITRLSKGDLILQKHLPYDIETPIHSVSKDFRKSLVQLLKSMPIYVYALQGYDKSVVADGGIALDEIDTKTMRSRKVTNLFVTGDLLDIRRPSGGFSLQLCWTTGFVAGTHALLEHSA
jgi:predicted Rossmann fold flavoprotein